MAQICPFMQSKCLLNFDTIEGFVDISQFSLMNKTKQSKAKEAVIIMTNVKNFIFHNAPSVR